MAHVFLARPAVLLPDEPTANLDATTKQLILALLEHHCADKTVVVISHDPDRPT